MSGESEVIKQMEDNFVDALNKWNGSIELGTFDRGVYLNGIWAKSHPITSYEDVGVPRLIKTFKKHSFFKNNKRVKDLKPGMFVSGGKLQNEGDLYDFLAS
jgi:hypothetical protein